MKTYVFEKIKKDLNHAKELLIVSIDIAKGLMLLFVYKKLLIVL